MPTAYATPKPLESPPSPANDSISREIFLEKLPLIHRITHSVSQRFHLSREDAEDFRSIVLLWLMEDNYSALRRFRRESRWRTYLTTLIRNRCRDFVIEPHGRWQNSKASLDAGADVMKLEILWRRDGFLLEEAIECLVHHRSSRRSREELRSLAEELPQRMPRFGVGEENLVNVPSGSSSDQRWRNRERRLTLQRINNALRQGFRKLSPKEQHLLDWQYRGGASLTEYANQQGIRRRKVYTIHARCLRHLRKELETAGVTVESIRQVLGWDDHQESNGKNSFSALLTPILEGAGGY